MTEHEMESGFELVLDNRKLIVIFAIAIVICGCFFVVGFMAGKRQGMIGAISIADSMTGPAMEQTSLSDEPVDGVDADVPALTADTVQQDLDWYQSANKKTGDPVGLQPPKESSLKKSTTPKPPAAGSKTTTWPTTYSVQVGAFKQRPEAETHSRDILSKGFESRIEPPESSGKLYLVKVGKFNTRAEAVGMRDRLKKKGFSCFVKTN